VRVFPIEALLAMKGIVSYGGDAATDDRWEGMD
jgi:hypothetical protein